MAPNPSVETLLHAFLPHKFVDHTHATAVLEPCRSAERPRALRRALRRPHGHRALHHAGLRARARRPPKSSSKNPKVEGPDPATSTASSPSATSAREAYERMIEMVTLAEERLQRNRKAVFVTAQLPQRVGGARRRRADPARRRAPARIRTIEGAWRRLIFDFRSDAAILNFVNGEEVGALQPGRRGHARPHHPHQELAAAGRAAPRRRQARRFPQRARATRRRMPSSTHYQALFRAQQRALRRRPRRCSIRCPASCWCRASACSGSAAARRTRRIAADLAEAAVEGITDAEAIGRFESIGEADMFDMRILVARAGQARHARTRSRSPARSRSITGAGRRDRRGDREGIRGGRRRGGAARSSTTSRGEGQGQGDRRRGARRAMRRDRRRVGARGLRPGGRGTSAASTSWCRMPAPPGRAASARSTRRCCARASS